MKGLIIILFLIINSIGFTQVTSGKIVFERKTNLLKKFAGNDRMKEWLKDKKTKIDVFELYFNDTISVFKPQESDLVEQMDWTTTKNTVYQNFSSGLRFSVIGVWGDKAYVEDSLKIRQWKMTSGKRIIAGYECRRVIWEKNDSTRIHAWFTQEISPPVGPESFNGLPGAILGLATEDGGVVYFAKSVTKGIDEIEKQIPEYPKKKVQTEAELKADLEEKFGSKPWGKTMLENIFEW